MSRAPAPRRAPQDRVGRPGDRPPAAAGARTAKVRQERVTEAHGRESTRPAHPGSVLAASRACRIGRSRTAPERQKKPARRA